MDINNLETFIEVAESKSFSRSAETLHLTQPAVSKRIAALETELSFKLFDRAGRTVHLTEAGKVLLPAARKITAEVSRISTEIITLGKEVGGKLSIGAIEHVGLDRLAPLLKSYRESYPGVEMDVRILDVEEMLSDIDSGGIELVLCSTNTPNPVVNSQLRLTNFRVCTEKQLVVAAMDHPLANFSNITVTELAEYPAVLPPPNSATRQSIDRIMGTNGVEAQIVMEARDMSATKSFAASGLGWALLPQSELNDNLAVLNVPDMQKTSYSQELILNSDRSLSRAAQALVELLAP